MIEQVPHMLTIWTCYNSNTLISSWNWSVMWNLWSFTLIRYWFRSPCWYVVSCWTIIGFIQGLINSRLSMEIIWLNNLWSMRWSCSNWLSSWSRSIFELVDTKLIVHYYNSYFFKLTKLTSWVFYIKNMYFLLEPKGLNDNGYSFINQFD
jgi:hypothetical protein